MVSINDPGQGRPAIRSGHVPALCPSQVSVGHAAAGICHALKAEVGDIGEDGGQGTRALLQYYDDGKSANHSSSLAVDSHHAE